MWPKDDFELGSPHLIRSRRGGFVSPTIPYFNVSEQLKCAIDRFYAINGTIKVHAKKAMFMVTYARQLRRRRGTACVCLKISQLYGLGKYRRVVYQLLEHDDETNRFRTSFQMERHCNDEQHDENP